MTCLKYLRYLTGFDQNGDGVISGEEFRDVMKKYKNTLDHNFWNQPNTRYVKYIKTRVCKEMV